MPKTSVPQAPCLTRVVLGLHALSSTTQLYDHHMPKTSLPHAPCLTRAIWGSHEIPSITPLHDYNMPKSPVPRAPCLIRAVLEPHAWLLNNKTASEPQTLTTSTHTTSHHHHQHGETTMNLCTQYHATMQPCIDPCMQSVMQYNVQSLSHAMPHAWNTTVHKMNMMSHYTWALAIYAACILVICRLHANNNSNIPQAEMDGTATMCVADIVAESVVDTAAETHTVADQVATVQPQKIIATITPPAQLEAGTLIITTRM